MQKQINTILIGFSCFAITLVAVGLFFYNQSQTLKEESNIDTVQPTLGVEEFGKPSVLGAFEENIVQPQGQTEANNSIDNNDQPTEEQVNQPEIDSDKESGAQQGEVLGVNTNSETGSIARSQSSSESSSNGTNAQTQVGLVIVDTTEDN